jgi:hypothetical protein
MVMPMMYVRPMRMVMRCRMMGMLVHMRPIYRSGMGMVMREIIVRMQVGMDDLFMDMDV